MPSRKPELSTLALFSLHEALVPTPVVASLINTMHLIVAVNSHAGKPLTAPQRLDF